MVCRVVLGILLAATLVSAVEIRVATFNIGAHFGDNYFDFSLGDPGTPDHDSVRDILARIDADVVALQEIHSADLQIDSNDLEALAGSLGYLHLHVPLTTNVFDTTFRTVFLSRFPLLTTDDVQSPIGAKDMTRLHPVVKVDVPGTNNDPVLVSVHLKSGTALADRFQRAVEMKRLTGWLSAAGMTDADNFIVLGDFNPSSVNTIFTELPATGLPGSFMLGSDITFPVTYSTNPLVYFSTPAAVRLDPRQFDGSASTYGTTSPGGPVLDLFLVSSAIAGRPVAGEVYNSSLDVSNAGGLPKAGVPLVSTTSSTASDHYAVFADLELDSTGSYVFTYSGQTVAGDFTGFGGSVDPAPWSTSGGSGWRGIDDGSSATPGWRVYGSGPGFLSDGSTGVMNAVFENQSSVPLTALEVALDAGQWRAVNGGAADQMRAELWIAGQEVTLPGLTYTASQSLPTGPVPGGGATRLTAIADKLWIPPGGSFELRLSFVPGDNTAPASADVFINEFHYDNDGTDTGEFVEVVVGPGFTGQLADIDVALYNGDIAGAGVVYNTLNLATVFTYVGTYADYKIFVANLPTNGIQNGPRDGFAIFNKNTSQVLQFISYEGVFTASSGPASGMVSTNIGVSQSGTEPVGMSSLGLTGTGGAAVEFTWIKAAGDYTKGAPNEGQAFVPPTLPSQGLAIDNLSVAILTDHDLDGLPDVSDPDDDNDGQSDDYETVFGSDPRNAASRFAPVLSRAGQVFELSFPGAPGVIYTVQACEDLKSWQNVSTRTGEGLSMVVPLPMDGAQRFFRVKAGDVAP